MAKCYGPALVLVVWALLLGAGMPLTRITTAVMLLAEALAAAIYIRDVRGRIR